MITRTIRTAVALAVLLSLTPSGETTDLNAGAASRFAELALSCVHREYPNKIAHVLASDADARPPRQLTPAFFGCFDWHSSVHGHWLLARLARLEPEAPFAARARQALARSLTAENIAAEVRYLTGEGRATFERPYGLAWMLEGIAAGLPGADPRIPALLAAAGAHRRSGLAAVTGEHYEGGHWLGTFAAYLTSGRGLPGRTAPDLDRQ
jgi:hypothetical protein